MAGQFTQSWATETCFWSTLIRNGSFRTLRTASGTWRADAIRQQGRSTRSEYRGLSCVCLATRRTTLSSAQRDSTSTWRAASSWAVCTSLRSTVASKSSPSRRCRRCGRPRWRSSTSRSRLEYRWKCSSKSRLGQRRFRWPGYTLSFLPRSRPIRQKPKYLSSGDSMLIVFATEKTWRPAKICPYKKSAIIP